MPETVTIPEPAATTAATPHARSAEGHSESESTAAEVAEASSSVVGSAAPPRMVSVIRRKRRRAKVDPRTLRLRLVLLAFVAGLLVLALAGGDLRREIGASVRVLLPAFTQGAQASLEVVVLVFAGLILLYLMPGVEERVLKALGVKRSSSSSRSGRSHLRSDRR